MCNSGLIHVRSNSGEMKTIDMFHEKRLRQGPCLTVLDLKQCAAKEFPKSGSKASEVRLIVVDKPLDNDSAPLCKSGIKPDTVVQMVRKVHGG